ncbi:hypothetical protein PGT21_019367 [Puccinia graminis f. sp. tritici]|uniref:Uncharacterized protein n=1 Tax=Puccinia graminis f. sp. tritici TaxID=56615 RepID=A0A5B0QIQ7_PUCGR|nr:hypothetical protein PGT21_019367 [Puccinia graminis f. sp. tritici]
MKTLYCSLVIQTTSSIQLVNRSPERITNEIDPDLAGLCILLSWKNKSGSFLSSSTFMIVEGGKKRRSAMYSFMKEYVTQSDVDWTVDRRAG